MSVSCRIPKYRLHKGSGQALVQIDGERIYLGKHGTDESRERYRRLVAELMAGQPSPPSEPGAQLEIVELIARYWEFCQGWYVKDGKPTGWQDHIRLVLRLLRETYGRTPADEFGPKRFKTFRQTLVDAGHSRKYVNKLVAIVLRMFKWAASEEMLPNSVHLNLRAVEGLRKGRCEAPERPPVLPVNDSIIEATLPHLPVIVADMVALQRLAGMRPDEVCIIRPCDVDRSTEVWTYRPESHKTEHFGRERIVYLGPKSQAVLMPYLLRDAQTYCFSPVESEKDRHQEMRARRKTRVQPSQQNRRKRTSTRAPKSRYSTDSYRRAIHRACEKAGIEKWAPNRLRHSAATKIRKAYGLEAAQVILGHATADITQVYAERDAELARSVALRIG